MFQLSCAAPSCQMRTFNFSDEQSKLAKSNYVVSFHKFPVDAEKRQAWIDAAQQASWKPSNNSCLCSLHFRDDCFDENNQLFDHAMPSIFFTDFRAYIKSIIKNINLEVNLESEASDDNEDILHKSLKNLSPVVSDNEEVVEYELSVSDDDFEIECEEVFISDDDACNESDPSVSAAVSNSTNFKTTPTPSKEKSVFHPEPTFEKSDIMDQKNISPNKTNIDIEEEEVNKNNKNIISNVTDVENISLTGLKENEPNLKAGVAIEVKNIENKQTSSDSSEIAKKLFSLIKSDSFNTFSIMQPASRNLVHELLNIVKLANTQNASIGCAGGSIPNVYIITTKRNEDSNTKNKIVLMETSEIVSLITSTVNAIKEGVYEKNDDISIICGSPAIFLIKNVIVQNFDQNMNSVYVITSENLLPYLYKLNTKTDLMKNPLKSNSNTDKILPKNSVTTDLNNLDIMSNLKKITSPSNARTTSALNLDSQSNLKKNSFSSSYVRIAPATKSNFIPKLTNSVVLSHMPKSSVTVGINTARENVTPIPKTSKLLNSSGIDTETSILSKTAVPSSSNTHHKIIGTGQNIKSPVTTMGVSTVRHKISNTTHSPKANVKLTNVSESWQNITPQLKSQSDLGHPSIKLNLTKSMQTVPIVMLGNSNQNSKQNLLTSNVPGPLQVSNNTIKRNVGQNAFKLDVSSPSKDLTPQAFKLSVCSPSGSLTPSSCSPVSESRLQSVRIPRYTTPKKSTKSPVFTIGDDSPSKEIPNTGSVLQKRKNEDEFNNNDSQPSLEPELKKRICDPAYLEKQQNEIQILEKSIIRKETEIITLRKKIQKLKKRYNAVKNPVDAKTDEQMVEDILKKYLDQDAVQFFVGQMKVSGKTYTQFRWTEEDKLFALSLLYKNPVEYHILFQRFTLPSDKTLNKFVARIKKAEMDVMK